MMILIEYHIQSHFSSLKYIFIYLSVKYKEQFSFIDLHIYVYSFTLYCSIVYVQLTT